MATEPANLMESDEISMKEVIINLQKWGKYLLLNWRIIILTGIVGGIVGLAYAYWKKPIYTASTTFVLESSTEGKGGLAGLASMASIAGINLGGNGGGLFQGNNILELYKSRKMLEQTLLAQVDTNSNELLIERYIAFNRLREDEWKDRPELLALDFRENPETLDSLSRRLRDGVITSFANAIKSKVLLIEKVDKNATIMQVDIASPDEEFSKVFNENLVRKVNEFYVQTKTKKSVDNIAILEQKVDSVRKEMTGAIYSVARVSDATPNLNPTRQVQRIAPTQEAQFSAETNKAMLSQLLQNLELTKMALLQEQPLIQLVDTPVYPLKVERLGKIKGILIGAFLFGFLAVAAIIIRKYFRNVMADDVKI